MKDTFLPYRFRFETLTKGVGITEWVYYCLIPNIIKMILNFHEWFESCQVQNTDRRFFHFFFFVVQNEIKY